LTKENLNEIIEVGHDLGGIADRHAGGIFLHGDIATIVKAGFNAPVSASNVQQGQGGSFLVGQTVDAKFHLIKCFDSVSVPPLKATDTALWKSGKGGRAVFVGVLVDALARVGVKVGSIGTGVEASVLPAEPPDSGGAGGRPGLPHAWLKRSITPISIRRRKLFVGCIHASNHQIHRTDLRQWTDIVGVFDIPGALRDPAGVTFIGLNLPP
jgi:hypothetical protein